MLEVNPGDYVEVVEVSFRQKNPVYSRMLVSLSTTVIDILHCPVHSAYSHRVNTSQ